MHMDGILGGILVGPYFMDTVMVAIPVTTVQAAVVGTKDGKDVEDRIVQDVSRLSAIYITFLSRF